MCICHRREDEMRMPTSGELEKSRLWIWVTKLSLGPSILFLILSVTHR